jgi:hypothetical protein
MSKCLGIGVRFEYVPEKECVPEGGFAVAKELAQDELHSQKYSVYQATVTATFDILVAH